jgi:Meckel syndrome type 1 protein
MNPTPDNDAPLRDARLARALEHAPDTLQPAQPAAAMRDAILRAAHAAVETPQTHPVAPPGRGWRAGVAGVWGHLMGTGRMPWNAALATVLLASFITLLWRDEPVPSAQTDPPIAASPPRADQQKEATAESARSTDSAGLAADSAAKQKTQEPSANRANRDVAPAAKPERTRRSQEGSAPPVMEMPPVATAPAAPAPASPAAEMAQAAPPAQASAPSIAPERAMSQEKSLAARRSAAVAAAGGVPEDWTELRGADGVAVARGGTGELPRLLESLRAEAAAPDARADGLARAEGEAAAPVVRVDLLRAGQLLGSLELAGRRWRFIPPPGGGAASQGVLAEAEAQALRAAMQRLQR